MEIHRQGHSVYYARYHLVISTKYRRKVLEHGMQDYLKRIVHDITHYHPDVKVLEANTDRDHMHLLLSIPPRYAVSDVVRLLKSNTGRAMRLRFPWLGKRVYYGTDGIWSDGYFVSTIGIDEVTIRKYIENQGKEDSGQAKLEP